MKKLLKIIIPLLLGLFLVWFAVKDMSSEDIDKMVNAMKSADYFWLIISVVLGIFSHISRAMRWKYTLEAIGANYSFKNSVFSVFISYLVNLAIPRAGELSRVAIYSKYENNSFDKTLGTVVAERVVDMILLMITLSIVLLLQFDNINAALGLDEMDFTKYLIAGSVGLIGLIIGYKVLTTTKNTFLLKVKSFFEGLIDGLKSIWTMKNKGLFLMHTAIIWTLYILMFWVSIFCLQETAHLGIEAIMTAFAAGGIAMIVSTGGLGAYPLALGLVLVNYGVEKEIGQALGWIMWTAQTLMILIFGALSFILIGILNKDKKII